MLQASIVKICTLYNVQVLKTKTILNNKNYVYELYVCSISTVCAVVTKLSLCFPCYLIKKNRTLSVLTDTYSVSHSHEFVFVIYDAHISVKAETKPRLHRFYTSRLGFLWDHVGVFPFPPTDPVPCLRTSTGLSFGSCPWSSSGAFHLSLCSSFSMSVC